MPAVNHRILCAVCRKAHDHGHSHHIYPQAYGGRDGPLVDLCATHHDMIHTTAAAAIAAHVSGRKSPQPWTNAGEWQRALPFIKAIVQLAVQARENGSHLYKVTLELSPEEREILGELKIRLGQSSLEKAIRKSLQLTYRQLTGKTKFN